jgi:predicted RNA-binding protein associated with RNAse of E/G family
MSKRVRIHYDRPGRGTTIFEEILVLDRPGVRVTLLADYAGRPAHAGAHRILDAGAPIVWFVFPDLWCDVGRFHLHDGTFTGWYTNLRKPVVFAGDDWHCTDLFLDLWQPVTGKPVWLDEDELADARERGLLDNMTLARVETERVRIDALVRSATWPPAITREVTLASAQRLIAAPDR